ncbi:hypothetical protein LZ32DRAFT_413461 [Colletotrichum eremochloae]|nr:hypothetical protein LZ32DRAFT_413461 [Colletotrichum eremochloae]
MRLRPTPMSPSWPSISPIRMSQREPAMASFYSAHNMITYLPTYLWIPATRLRRCCKHLILTEYSRTTFLVYHFNTHIPRYWSHPFGRLVRFHLDDVSLHTYLTQYAVVFNSRSRSRRLGPHQRPAIPDQPQSPPSTRELLLRVGTIPPPPLNIFFSKKTSGHGKPRQQPISPLANNPLTPRSSPAKTAD